jgi:signal peptidase I
MDLNLIDKKIVSWGHQHKALLAVILILAALLVCIDIYDVTTYGRAIPIVMVEGNSMNPTYHDGQLVTVYTLDKEQPVLGDVIVYMAHGINGRGYVAHRIVEANPDGTFITQGDNNYGTDQAMLINYGNVTPSQIYGVVGGALT